MGGRDRIKDNLMQGRPLPKLLGQQIYEAKKKKNTFGRPYYVWFAEQEKL